ncbi:RelA/SpoT family protein [Sinorhizobium phage phiN3]|uniref:RelA/SpoT family protein n=1 Tax=Sinorhizobium phage phiN3 TaxID=1647405 RepID=A0A0F6WCQ2_9CAUD|nr:RelA/SpoT family protein [Sinorhizobium phage phiN3]AKF13546.1 RelA/SpoT family protein [Sinorhizobium phage phiN3]
MSLLKEFREYQKALQEQALLAETDAYFEAYDQMYDQLEEAVVLNENTLVNPAFSPGEKLAELGTLAKQIAGGIISKADIADKLGSVYDKFKNFFESVKDKFKTILQKAANKFSNTKILAQLKPLKSLLDKVDGRGKSLSSITDLVRGAAIFEDREDAEKFVKDLQRKHGDKIVEFVEKTKGSDMVYGYYGTYHLLIEIDGIICEIQVATKKLWKQKKLAHKVYTATRSSSDGPSKEDSQLSKRLFSKGNR